MEPLKHPGVAALDQHAAGLLQPSEQGAVEAHLLDCPSCTSQLEEIRRDRSAFLAVHPPAAEVHRLLGPSPTPSSWLRPWLLGLPAAAALAIFVVARSPVEPEIRFKGADAVAVWAHPRNGPDFEVKRQGDHPFLPNDELRVKATAATAGEMALWAVDAQGQATLLERAPTQAGTALEWAIQVDQSPDPDRLFVISSEEPLSERAVRAALGEAFRAAGQDLERMQTVDLGGAAVTSYWLPKPIKKDLP